MQHYVIKFVSDLRQVGGFSTNGIDPHYITEILLKVALNTMILTLTTVIICCQIFCDLFINSAFERIFNVMQLILVKLSGILSKNI
jgi:hypothetical protein